MNLIEPKVEVILPKDTSLESQYKLAEIAGRVSYLSQDKITDDSYKEFIERLIKNRHYAPLEFCTVYLKAPENKKDYRWFYDFFKNNPYSRVWTYGATTNLRVIKENNLEKLLDSVCSPSIHFRKRVMVHFTLPISISREFIRHRAFSFMEMSTRYINIFKDRYGGDLDIIKPLWYDKRGDIAKLEFEYSMHKAAKAYKTLLEEGCTPQEVRDVLPLSTKTELYMCGFMNDWKHFLDLRCTNNAHPMAKLLADNLKEKFKVLGYIKNDK